MCWTLRTTSGGNPIGITGLAVMSGVVARIVPGPHDAHRQDPVRLEFPILSLNPGLRQRCMAPDVWPTLSRA